MEISIGKEAGFCIDVLIWMAKAVDLGRKGSVPGIIEIDAQEADQAPVLVFEEHAGTAEQMAIGRNPLIVQLPVFLFITFLGQHLPCGLRHLGAYGPAGDVAVGNGNHTGRILFHIIEDDFIIRP